MANTIMPWLPSIRWKRTKRPFPQSAVFPGWCGASDRKTQSGDALNLDLKSRAGRFTGLPLGR